MSSNTSLRSVSPGQSAGRPRRTSRRSVSGATIARGVAFLSAILSALCAGSVTVFSLYGHIFQERLHYSQFQVNGVAIAASIACYLPVPLLGYMCDRTGPAPLSLLAAVLFGLGYGMAAILYKEADTKAGSLDGHKGAGPSSWAYACMLAAFISIGVGTCGMYLSAVATCAKNFGRGKHRGMALAMPIAAYGLSGMWQSQVGSRLLYERLPPLEGGDGKPRRGDVDVFAFFIFLAVLLVIVGIIGTFTLRVVDEDELINEAVNELERSGLLNGSSLFPPSAPSANSEGGMSSSTARIGPGTVAGSSGNGSGNGNSSSGRGNGYGTMDRPNPYSDNARAGDSHSDNEALAAERRRVLRHRLGTDVDDDEDDALAQRLLDPRKDHHDDGGAGGDDDDDETDSQAALKKKQWVLNAETRRFLTDHTMWLFALGFFFMIGPGEAFINNLGTVIQTLYPPAMRDVASRPPTTAATHVSIVGITSTIARLLTGSLTDLLAPQPQTQHLQVSAADIERAGSRGGSPSSSRPVSSHGSTSSFSSDDSSLTGFGSGVRHHHRRNRLAVSRVSFLLFFALVLSAGLVVLASGAVQNHGERFWIVSGLVGAGYGAVFSLTPIIITVIWGVENFGTNWGIVAMFPALGATLWGLIYSAVYQAGVGARPEGSEGPEGSTGSLDDETSNLCYGMQCYAPTFWAMSMSVWIACVLVLLAWKGRRGWSDRKIVI